MQLTSSTEIAEVLGAPIVGKAAVPDDSPYTTGGIGLLDTEPSQDAIEGCDTLFMIGTSFPYVEFLPEPGSVKCVQIDIDPQRISLRHPADVAGWRHQDMSPCALAIAQTA
jgi:pyruvate dehydrogenase (quinone)